MSRRFEYPIVFLVSAAWYAICQNWGATADPDVFYHAKAALLIAASGPLKAFPWLDLTAYANNFADQHFLFHVLLIPFVKLGGMYGAQIAAVLFSALAITVFYFVLKNLAVRYPWLWAGLALINGSILFRFELGKASPLAIAWFLLGMLAMIKPRPWLGFFVGIGFALTHFGFALLLACQGVYLFAAALYQGVEKHSWRRALNFKLIKPFLLTVLGVGVGILVHPNARNVVVFFWTNITQIAASPQFQHVNLGNEWKPMGIGDAMLALGLHIVLALVAIIGMLATRRAERSDEKAKRAISFFFPAALLFALMLKSQRMSEYAAPAMILWIALLWDNVNLTFLKTAWRNLVEWMKNELPKPTVLPLLVLYACVPAAFLISGAINTFQLLHAPKTSRAFNQYQPAVDALNKAADQDERVFNTRWDDFPQLFWASSRVRYVAGLDPTFLLVADPGLSKEYSDLVSNQSATSVRDIVSKDFGSRFIVSTKNDPKSFWKMMDEDPKTELIYGDLEARVYKFR